MAVGNICTREVDTIVPDASAYIAAERMLERAVGTLVVVNADCQPIGLVTDRDLVERVLAKGRDSMNTAVGDIMTTDIQTVMEQTPIESALAGMRGGRFRRLPVVNDQRQVIGLISLDDILMFLSGEFQEIGGLLEEETPRFVVTGRQVFANELATA